MKWLVFLKVVMPVLIELARELFVRHKGDAGAAVTDLRRIPDHWRSVDAERAAVDRERAAFHAKSGPTG